MFKAEAAGEGAVNSMPAIGGLHVTPPARALQGLWQDLHECAIVIE